MGAQKNRLNEAIPLSIHNMFSIINMKAKFQLLKQLDLSPLLLSNLPIRKLLKSIQFNIFHECSKEQSQRRRLLCFHSQTRKLT